MTGLASQAQCRPITRSTWATPQVLMIVVTVLADTAVRAQDIDEAAVRAAKEEAERILSKKDPKMSMEEAQTQLAMSIAQLSALERLRKNMKH